MFFQGHSIGGQPLESKQQKRAKTLHFRSSSVRLEYNNTPRHCWRLPPGRHSDKICRAGAMPVPPDQKLWRVGLNCMAHFIRLVFLNKFLISYYVLMNSFPTPRIFAAPATSATCSTVSLAIPVSVKDGRCNVESGADRRTQQFLTASWIGICVLPEGPFSPQIIQSSLNPQQLFIFED